MPGDAPAAETEPVFVAAVDINFNDQVTKDKLKIEEWPKDKIHADALRTLDQIKGQRAAHKIFAGEQIRGDKLMGADGQVSGSDKIPAGYRVIAVRVDAVTGAAGLILPNDRVDVLVYMARNPGIGIEETSTKTILQDVRVFAVDTQFERRKGTDEPAIAAKTISLLVTPAQAEKVTLATEMGTLRLIMRSPDDSLEGTAGGASIKDIFNQTDKLDVTERRPAAGSSKHSRGQQCGLMARSAKTGRGSRRRGGAGSTATPCLENDLVGRERGASGRTGQRPAVPRLDRTPERRRHRWRRSGRRSGKQIRVDSCHRGAAAGRIG